MLIWYEIHFMLVWVANNGAYKDFILDIGDYSFLDTDQYLIGANDLAHRGGLNYTYSSLGQGGRGCVGKLQVV